MTIETGDILKAVVEIVLGDFTITQNVHYFSAGITSDMLDSVCLGLIEAWVEAAYAELHGDLCDDYAIGQSTVHKIDWNGGLGKWETTYYVGQFTPTFLMQNSAEPLPNQCSAFITLNTSRPQTRGRKFLQPFGEDRQAATILTPAAVAEVAAFADLVLDQISFGAFGALYPGVPRQSTGDFLTFTGAVVTDILGTQRRRRPGVGS